jgi:phenylalanyl-tRNA synthetase beta chain
MNFSYNWLKTFFDKPLPQPKELAEILTMHCFENESLEKKGNDYILGIDVLPDRAGDCLCHIGIAKEIGAVLNRKANLPKITVKENKKTKAKDLLSVQIKDKKACKRYIARVLTNVKIAPSPKWLQERLIACGLNSINNVVDVTNFVMLEMGQPLHAFDYKNITDQKIIVRMAEKGEKMTTLSGLAYKLDEKTLVIADNKSPLALAGIKGGQRAEINCDTETIVLESANFNAKLISQTARKINLRTDASIRFEQNLDPNLCEAAVNRAAMLIAEIANAQICDGIIDAYPEKLKPNKVKLEFRNLNDILGVEIKPTEAVAILKRLGIETTQKTAKGLTAIIPTSRQDITIPENLIEEIGRVYGYKNVTAEFPCDYLKPAKRNDDIFWQDQAKDIFKELGYSEIYNYSFIGEKEKDIFKLEAVKIKNPVSIEFEYLRPDLIPQLLNNTRENLKSFREFKIFELNKVFLKEKTKTKENRMLSGVRVSTEEKPQQMFVNLRGEINLLLNKLGIENINYKTGVANIAWNKQNSLLIVVRGKEIGEIGQISSEILDKLQIKEKVFGFTIDFEKLQPLCSEIKEYEPISFHPAATRDISGLVPRDTSIEELTETILKIDRQLIKAAEAFDIYQGTGVPEGQKSVSFHIIYQSDERTLDPQTIDKLQKQVLENLNKSFNWQIR